LYGCLDEDCPKCLIGAVCGTLPVSTLGHGVFVGQNLSAKEEFPPILHFCHLFSTFIP
jgi:hypothetical protein